MKKKASMDLRLHRESPYDIGVYSKKYKDDNLGMALTSNLVAGAGVGAATGGVTSGVTGRGPLRSASGAVFGGKDAIVSPKHLKDIKFYRAAGAGAAMAPAGPAAQAMAFAGNLD